MWSIYIYKNRRYENMITSEQNYQKNKKLVPNLLANEGIIWHDTYRCSKIT